MPPRDDRFRAANLRVTAVTVAEALYDWRQLDDTGAYVPWVSASPSTRAAWIDAVSGVLETLAALLAAAGAELEDRAGRG